MTKGRSLTVTRIVSLKSIEVQCKVKVVPVHTMKTYGNGGRVPPIFNLGFLCSSLASRPGLLTTGERSPGTHRTKHWVDPTADVDALLGRKISWSCRKSNHTSLS